MIYESPKSIAVENAIATIFAIEKGMDWERYTPPGGGYVTPDHIFLFRDAVVLHSETKRRYCKFRRYEDYFIDEAKVDALMEFDPKGIILVGFNDVVAFVQPRRNPPYKKSIGGRYDRGDSNDIDRLAHFKWEDFFIVNPYPFRKTTDPPCQ